MRHHPGKIISLPPSSSAITTPNPNTSLRRNFHSLTAHTSSHATKGHASCGLIVANPSNAPPQNKNPPATPQRAPQVAYSSPPTPPSPPAKKKTRPPRTPPPPPAEPPPADSTAAA